MSVVETDARRVELAPGYRVHRLINGCWQLAAGHGAWGLGGERAAALRHLEALWDEGRTTFDCADIYTGVEETLGELRRRLVARSGDPEPIQIHTKLVPDRSALPGVDRSYVERIVDRSLRRLGVERIDLVQFYWWDEEVPGCVDAVGWLDELRRAGKVRLLGVTNFCARRLQPLLDAGLPIRTAQVQYSLLDRRPHRRLETLAREHGIALLGYGSLAGGFLAERFLGAPPPPADENRSQTKYRLVIEEAGGWDAYQELLRRLSAVAARHGVGMAAVAVRWVLDQPQVAAAIVGASPRGGEPLEPLGFALDDEDRALLEGAGLCELAGDVYELEREPGGRHAAIMRYDLNREA
ncbi:MAG TPA: aldo/keto reductase [Thermoanaerobaculia bacterium]|nr:aldo/keto reductase [Thermoanaerobaculia bacterium]